MEKDQKVLIGLIVFVFLAVVGILIYLFVNNKDINNDALKFKKEYESLNTKVEDNIKYLKVKINSNNLFVYQSDEQIVKKLDKDTALIYFGFAKCPYCRGMVNLLNDIAKEKGLKKIYYVDIKNIRDSYEAIDGTVVKITNGTSYYYEIIDKLDNYLSDYIIKDDKKDYNTGVKRLYAPTLVAIKNGKVVGFHEGTVNKSSKNGALNNKEKEELKKIYTNIIDSIMDNTCLTENC